MNGSALKAAREQANLTQEEVARAAGISLRGYQNYEHELRQPPLKTALTLASMLGIPLESLVLHHETDVNGGDSAEVIPQTGIASEDRSK